MPAFMFSVAVLTVSTSLGVNALEAGRVETALVGFICAAMAGLMVTRSFVRGVAQASKN